MRVASVAIFVAAMAAVSLSSTEAHASCAHVEDRQLRVQVKSCEVVDAQKPELRGHGYDGLLVTVGGDPVRAWIPAREGLSCTSLPPGTTIEGKMSFACCDGDPNPPCHLDSWAILTGVRISSAASGTSSPPTPSASTTAPDAAREQPSTADPGAAPPSSQPTPGARGCGCSVAGADVSLETGWLLAVFAVARAARRRAR